MQQIAGTDAGYCDRVRKIFVDHAHFWVGHAPFSIALTAEPCNRYQKDDERTCKLDYSCNKQGQDSQSDVHVVSHQESLVHSIFFIGKYYYSRQAWSQGGLNEPNKLPLDRPLDWSIKGAAAEHEVNSTPQLIHRPKVPLALVLQPISPFSTHTNVVKQEWPILLYLYHHLLPEKLCHPQSPFHHPPWQWLL